jgi:hypothetical protein
MTPNGCEWSANRLKWIENGLKIDGDGPGMTASGWGWIGNGSGMDGNGWKMAQNTRECKEMDMVWLRMPESARNARIVISPVALILN